VHRVLKKWHTPNGTYFNEKGDAGHVYSLISADKVVGRVTRLKKGTKTLDLTLPLSRMANLMLSTWFHLTASCVSRLKSSQSRTITRGGKVLERVAAIASRFLVMACFASWYPSEGRPTRESSLS
jgi:hypothetical protein